MVTREKDGAPMYFRFYDPRVLRGFLPITTVRQEELVFGPVEQFLVERMGGGKVRSIVRATQRLPAGHSSSSGQEAAEARQ
jgi:hypothetical protein